MYYWLSWYQKADDSRPLTYPPHEYILGFWVTGYRIADDAQTVCAMVRAATEEDAKAVIRKEWPEADEWRFCDPKTPPLALSDRFPLSAWAAERFAIYNRYPVYEDELPSGMSEADYAWWFAHSALVDGVRMGPYFPKTTAQEVR